MKKLVIIGSMLLLLLIMTACANTGTTGNGDRIEPGDKIGDFTITTGVEGQFTYGFSIECSELGQNNTYNCNARVGEAVNVSTGLYDTTGSGKLDEVWAHSSYQMFINDREVDLAAFGTIDFNSPQVGVIRFGNVVITADKPGEITVLDAGVFDNGDPFSSTSTYVFTEP